MCEQEANAHETRRIDRHIRESGLPISKNLSSFDFNGKMAPYRARIEALASTPDWVERADNLLLFGSSGAGKTHMAAAIGHALITQGIRVRYFPSVALVQMLQQARNELWFTDALHKLDKYPVLILDDMGYVRKSEAETHALFELISSRYEAGSMIVTSNQPFSQWDEVFTECHDRSRNRPFGTSQHYSRYSGAKLPQTLRRNPHQQPIILTQEKTMLTLLFQPQKTGHPNCCQPAKLIVAGHFLGMIYTLMP